MRDYQTIDMVQDKKSDLFTSGHPVIRLLGEIPEIIMDINELPDNSISLKELFGREQMDASHLNSEDLIAMAGRILQIFDALAERKITAGLYDPADFYTVPDDLDRKVYLCHPERFQLLNYEQDYEWYPEDEKVFGETELFDMETQEKADCRLIYKVLIGASRGNVRIPPKMNDHDYSDMFYKKLSPALKSFFEEGSLKRSELRILLDRQVKAIQEQKKSAQEKQESDHVVYSPEPVEKTIPMQCVVLLLRTDESRSVKIGNLLYNLCDALEMEAEMAGYDREQGYIYGDGVIHVRKLMKDPKGFRVGLSNQIKSYSAGEAMIIAAEYYADVIRRDPVKRKERRLMIITDGDLPNDALFAAGLDKIRQLKELGVHIYMVTSKAYQGEALRKLAGILEHAEDYYVDQTVESF